MSDEPAPRPVNKELTEQEKAAVADFYERYGDEVIRQVRKYLRRTTRERTAASTSAVAQSVWISLMESHLGEVDLSDEESAWRVLFEAAGPRFCEGLVQKHCEKWNKAAYRHPQTSLEGLAAGTHPDEAAAAGFDPEDDREPAPEVLALARECVALCRLLDKADRELAEEAVARVEVSIGLVERLTPREREVLGLKLAGRTRPEIAEQVGITNAQVDAAWKSVKEKARRMGSEGNR
jgi:RNA polymerase sigma factor (sigma-70 family)